MAISIRGKRMADKRLLEWDDIGDPKRYGSTDLYRAKVPGGWLVRLSSRTNYATAETITFYPDSDHIWDGGSLP
jgi:hypothetical protein